MEGENNESVYNRFGITYKGEGMKCGVVEEVKHNTCTCLSTHRNTGTKWDDKEHGCGRINAVCA